MMIRIGYHSTGGYKLFDVVNKRIMINRDVVVNELKQVQQGVTGYQQTLTGYMHAITSYMQAETGYQKVLTNYNFEISNSEERGSAEQPLFEARNEENVRRSTWHRGLP